VFPHTNDEPSGTGELAVRIQIALNVRVELCQPPDSICPGNRPVFRTSVPEAAVDKDCNLRSREREINLATPAYDVHVDAITKTTTPER
jgi:hypothetical protein